MAIDSNWDRWIFASICKHFDTGRGSLSMFVEGQHRDTRDLKDFFELRMDGPRYTEISKNYWYIYIEVNCLVQSAMDDTDWHRIHKDVGLVASIFSDIPIYKYGNGPSDDDTLFGCLKLKQDERRRERVQTYHLGQVETSTKLMQAVVEGHYDMQKEVAA